MPKITKENEKLIEKTKTTKSKTTTKKATKKNTTTPKKTTSKSKATKSSKTVKSAKKQSTSKKTNTISEYYDLPQKYNETIVKVLAQTPKTLFIYWEISDDDISKYKKEYGENFFETTKPVLIVHNDTLNYSFEVEINDFANS